MQLSLRSWREDQPGDKWQALFKDCWPQYRQWFLCEGPGARPGYVTASQKLRQFMPELAPLYERLNTCAGGGDLEARFLSLYCPPPYMAACSQAIWRGPRPFLVRNYDYSPQLFEGALLYTCWLRPVIAVSDCLWGVLDGINDAGLCLSLSFGGRPAVGEGFGAPLLLRYILEICDTAEQARQQLARVPVHMPYNISVLDADGRFTTAYLDPQRPPQLTDEPLATNHQGQVEWPAYARSTSTLERHRLLRSQLADKSENAASFTKRFLQSPLYNTQYEKAFGTLYTARYCPRRKQARYLWPQTTLDQSFDQFTETEITLEL